MGVVELHSNLIRELLPLAARLGIQEGLDHILQCCGNEEVLLLETQLLACPVVIVGIENLGDLERTMARSKSLLVISLIELGKVNILVWHSRPEAKRVRIQGIITRNRRVVCNSDNFLCSIKDNRVCDVESLNLPRVAVSQPSVREFHLHAVLDSLFKHTMLISDAITPRRQVKRSHGIKEAGSKSSKTTVSKGSVFLLLNHVL
mmetsp:Transcript_28787/g.60277  ORF Transcript_28787/g.60277 Transcript_28787/m.60277 type:complete len:204 (-) Transcript_28787:608-1219(-)